MATALITGVSGFIGTHLAQALVQREVTTHGLIRCSSRAEHLKRLNITFHMGDIRDPKAVASAVAKADIVYHLAGLTKSLEPRRMMRVNQQGVKNVVAACAARPTPPILILVSSLAAAGPSLGHRPRIESDPARPISFYGRTKRAGELAAIVRAAEVPLTIVRPPIVFGERDTDFLYAIRVLANWGLYFLPAPPEQRISLLHATDLANLLALAASKGTRVSNGAEEHGCYYAASETDPTYRELGLLLAEAIGNTRFRSLRIPKSLTWLLFGSVDLLSRIRGSATIISLDKARDLLAGPWTCSAAKARKDLGYHPLAPLQERLLTTVTWYRKRGWLGL